LCAETILELETQLKSSIDTNYTEIFTMILVPANFDIDYKFEGSIERNEALLLFTYD